MVDINSEKYLEKLNKACASKEGQVIIEFLKHEAHKFDYETIARKEFKDFSLTGMEFKVIHEINTYFKDVLSRLDGTDK